MRDSCFGNRTCSRLMGNELFLKTVFFIIWSIICLALFVNTFVKFNSGANYQVPREVLSVSLPMARGAAAVINFSSVIILLTVCRNLISQVRRRLSCRPARLLDENIALHKVAAWTMILAACVHTGAHFFNVLNATDPGAVKVTSEDPGTDPIIVLLTTVAGTTGAVLSIAIFLMATSSLEFIRRSYYDLFWAVHQFFVVVFVIMCVHGLGGFVMEETNPSVCNSNTAACEYKPVGGATWKWIVGPFVLYLLERVLRYTRARRAFKVLKVVQHPSKVLEIQVEKKPWFKPRVGQYCFLNVDEIAPFEWHAITLSSAPEETYVSVHIRVLGDWTEKLAKRLGCRWDSAGDVAAQPVADSFTLPRIGFDGPFGTPTEDVFKYEVSMCVGAGIGVTPFASVLKSIWYHFAGMGEQQHAKFKLKKVYFYWIARDKDAFEWFVELLDALEALLEENGAGDFLESNIFLTGAMGEDLTTNVLLNTDENVDAITGLRSKTRFGRPDWHREFQRVSGNHPNAHTGVFLCGPGPIANILQKQSQAFTVPGGNTFSFQKEHF